MDKPTKKEIAAVLATVGGLCAIAYTALTGEDLPTDCPCPCEEAAEPAPPEAAETPPAVEAEEPAP